MILGDPDCPKLVILEGRRRLTAMTLARDRLPAEVSLLLGTSAAIDE